jgi:hypothetical protein
MKRRMKEEGEEKEDEEENQYSHRVKKHIRAKKN